MLKATSMQCPSSFYKLRVSIMAEFKNVSWVGEWCSQECQSKLSASTLVSINPTRPVGV